MPTFKRVQFGRRVFVVDILACLIACAIIIFRIVRTATRIINTGLPTLTGDIGKRQWNARWESCLKTIERLPNPIFMCQMFSRLTNMGHSGAMES